MSTLNKIKNLIETTEKLQLRVEILKSVFDSSSNDYYVVKELEDFANNYDSDNNIVYEIIGNMENTTKLDVDLILRDLISHYKEYRIKLLEEMLDYVKREM